MVHSKSDIITQSELTENEIGSGVETPLLILEVIFRKNAFLTNKILKLSVLSDFSSW